MTTDTSTNRILRMADDMHRFGATPSRARKVVNVLRALAAERDELRAESVNYADALAAQNNVIDGLMAENAELREALAAADDDGLTVAYLAGAHDANRRAARTQDPCGCDTGRKIEAHIEDDDGETDGTE